MATKKTAKDYLEELKAEQAPKTPVTADGKKMWTAADDAAWKLKQAEQARDAMARRGWAGSAVGDYGRLYNQGVSDVFNSNQRLQSALAGGGAAGGAGGMSDAELKAEANKREAYDLARGGVDRVTEDPIDALIREQLTGVATGKSVPFNEEVRNALFSEQADMGGAANASRAEKILAQATERGLNPNDPGVQAALRNSLTTQQLGAQGARQDIAKTANRENFAAQQRGLNQLSGVNESYQNRITGMEDRLRGMLWNEGFNQRTAMPAMASTPVMQPTLPSFSQYNQRQQPINSGGNNALNREPVSGMIEFSGRSTGGGNQKSQVFPNAAGANGRIVNPPNNEGFTEADLDAWDSMGMSDSPFEVEGQTAPKKKFKFLTDPNSYRDFQF